MHEHCRNWPCQLEDRHLGPCSTDTSGNCALTNANGNTALRALGELVADRDRLRAALASVVKHWREFGPEHGFDETLERAALAGGAEPPSVLGIPVVVDPTMKPGTWELRPAVVHASDCAVHNEPYKPAGPCNCNLADDAPTVEQLIAISEQQK